MKLEQTVKQTQKLSPKVLQFVNILQRNAQELEVYLEEKIQENPVLEVNRQDSDDKEIKDISEKLTWLGSEKKYSRNNSDDEDELHDIENYGTNSETDNLYVFLAKQLAAFKLKKELELAAKFLIDCIDNNGYLCAELELLAEQSHYSVDLLEKALYIIQQLDPAGIGALNLSECLCLQLERLGLSNSLPWMLAKYELEDLASGHFSHLSHKYNVDVFTVKEAVKKIKLLDPKPGNKYETYHEPIYVVPDIIIKRNTEHIDVQFNDYHQPNLIINSYYQRLLRQTKDINVKKYLLSKVKEAQWVINSIQQRKTTILDCANCIVKKQELFFLEKSACLKPLTLADIATTLGIHVSTVSRAIGGKYLQCSRGLFPLHYFFTSKLTRSCKEENEQDISSEAVKVLLRNIVITENKSKPLSDQKLCYEIKKHDINISRRTVAKYRESLNIPNASERKK